MFPMFLNKESKVQKTCLCFHCCQALIFQLQLCVLFIQQLPNWSSWFRVCSSMLVVHQNKQKGFFSGQKSDDIIVSGFSLCSGKIQILYQGPRGFKTPCSYLPSTLFPPCSHLHASVTVSFLSLPQRALFSTWAFSLLFHLKVTNQLIN